jgi:hypothetical protein
VGAGEPNPRRGELVRETRIEGSSKAPWIILVIFGAVMAFLGYEMLEFKRAGKQIHGVEVHISPAQLVLKPGERRLLEASIAGSENSDIGWSVQEGSAGGAVVPSNAKPRTAIYTAPATVGSYHVIAVSKADETRTATATIEVLQ